MIDLLLNSRMILPLPLKEQVYYIFQTICLIILILPLPLKAQMYYILQTICLIIC